MDHNFEPLFELINRAENESFSSEAAQKNQEKSTTKSERF